MNKFIKRITYVVGITVAIIAAGCSDDIDPEITTLNVSRLFSPVDLLARVVNKTAVRLEWTEVNNAVSYTIEVFDNEEENFDGAAIKTISGVTFDQTPYDVTGFDGETDYSVRVKAVGEDIADSKWVSATFKTDPEHIFYDLVPEEITAFTVVLRWPAGEFATSIVLSPGDITHVVTSDEIDAGVATLTGLTSETAYTAKLMNGIKTRGTLQFKTAIDVGDAILVTNADDLKALVEAANEGDVFALLPGEYAVANSIYINKSIGIIGVRPYDKPVIKGAILRVKAGSGLRLKDVLLDGTTSDGNQMIVYDDALLDGTYGALVIEDCVIKNYTKGNLYINVAALIESVTINGCIFSDIECNGGDFIDFRQGIAKTFDFTNNTVYNSALARDFFRMDSGGSTNFPAESSVISITNNTFNKVSNGSTRRLLYIRLASHTITFNKNILANTEGYYTNQAATTIVAMSNNNYHNAPNFTASATSGAKNDTGTYTSLDPGFTNADAGDFTVANEDLILNGIGDPQWLQ